MSCVQFEISGIPPEFPIALTSGLLPTGMSDGHLKSDQRDKSTRYYLVMSRLVPFPPEIVHSIDAGASVLRAVRDHSGRTLEEVAHACGVLPARLWEIEAGVTPTLAERQALSELFGYDEDVLIDL
ncbi:helix-turn-helix transcriptional regulator [Aurantimonas sp. E1-2-R+4]|uniref:helix-turn-helix domain-containing protein n=1 Tax=Aurantimonas sp. E1-2-R+4 TaxID=3113714 RepID=UPI002F9543E4